MSVDITFRQPPVVETVLGVQFTPLAGLTNGHLGAFWREEKPDWPTITDAPLLDEQFETFGGKQGWIRGIHLRLTQSPASRLQIRNATGDRMVQLQNCRLDYNWIAQVGPPYPRYRVVRPEFDATLKAFRGFVARHKLGELQAAQWEVTYVNRIPRGSAWKDPDELPTLFTGLLGQGSVPSDLRLEGFGGHWHYEIQPQRGRLHVELEYACQEALVLKLTARGPIDRANQTDQAIDEGLNLGHDVIVTSFADMTSEKAHMFWNRGEENHD